MTAAPGRLLTYEERRALRRRLRAALVLFVVGAGTVVAGLWLLRHADSVTPGLLVIATGGAPVAAGVALFGPHAGAVPSNLAAERRRAVVDVLIYAAAVVLLAWMTGLIDHLRSP
jgi:hypothetical protein